MISILSFMIVLGVLIFFHELGHFITAKLCGIGVEKFSIGFGPKLFGKTVGNTDYRISVLPLGGYVKMVGENPDDEIDVKDIPISFSHKPVFQRALVVAAGPIFNILLAYFIFFAVLFIQGKPTLLPIIGGVKDNTPAYTAKLQAKDHVLQINQRDINSWDEMSNTISECQGKPIVITVKRGDELFDVTLTPEKAPSTNLFGENIERYLIGVHSAGEVTIEPLSLGQSLIGGAVNTWDFTKFTLLGILKIVQGVLSPDNLGGPIMIFQMAGETAQQGASSFIYFIAIISISLAIFNLLPIPVLDGGHLFFFAIEAIIRKPVSIQIRERAQQFGIMILISLMIYASYNDIMRFFSAN